jgi:hypothetical protein
MTWAQIASKNIQNNNYRKILSPNRFPSKKSIIDILLSLNIVMDIAEIIWLYTKFVCHPSWCNLNTFIPSEYKCVYERKIKSSWDHSSCLDITHFYEVYNIEKYVNNLSKTYNFSLTSKFSQNSVCLVHIGRIQTWYDDFFSGVSKGEEINNYIEFYPKKNLILSELNSYDNVLVDKKMLFLPRSSKSKSEIYLHKVSFLFDIEELLSVVLIDTYDKFCENINICKKMYKDESWIKIYFPEEQYREFNFASIESNALKDYWQIWKNIFVPAIIQLNSLSNY